MSEKEKKRADIPVDTNAKGLSASGEKVNLATEIAKLEENKLEKTEKELKKQKEEERLKKQNEAKKNDEYVEKRRELNKSIAAQERIQKNLNIFNQFKDLSQGSDRKFPHTTIMEKYFQYSPKFEIIQESKPDEEVYTCLYQVSMNNNRRITLKVSEIDENDSERTGKFMYQYLFGKSLAAMTKGNYILRSLELKQIKSEKPGKIWVELLSEYSGESHYLSECRKFKPGDSILIAYQLVEILIRLEERGLGILRIKPENILVDDKNSQIRLNDISDIVPLYSAPGMDNVLFYESLEKIVKTPDIYTPPEIISKPTKDLWKINGEKIEVFNVGLILCGVLQNELKHTYTTDCMEFIKKNLNTSKETQNIGEIIESCLKSSPEERPTLIQLQYKLWCEMQKIKGKDFKQVIEEIPSLDYRILAEIFHKLKEFEAELWYIKKFSRCVKCRIGPTDESFNPDLVLTYKKLGEIYYQFSLYDNAIKYDLKYLKGWKTLYGEEHSGLINIYNNLGVLYAESGNPNKAIEYCLFAEELMKNISDNNMPELAQSYNCIGSAYSDLTQYEYAIEYFNKALALNIEFKGETDSGVAATYNSLGIIYTNLKNFDRAQECYKKAWDILRAKFGKNQIDIATIKNNIATLYKYKGDTQQAKKFYQKAEKKRNCGEKAGSLSAIYNNLGCIYRKEKDYINSNDYLKKALSCKKMYPIYAARANYYLGLNSIDAEDYKPAIEFFKSANNIMVALFGEHDPESQVINNQLMLAYCFIAKTQIAYAPGLATEANIKLLKI